MDKIQFCAAHSIPLPSSSSPQLSVLPNSSTLLFQSFPFLSNPLSSSPRIPNPLEPHLPSMQFLGRGGACSRRRPDICSRFNKHGLTNERDCGDREVCRRFSSAMSAVHPSVGRSNHFDSASGSNPRKGCNVDPSVESDRQAKRNGRRMGRLGMRRMEVNRDGLNWLGEEQGKTGCVD